MKAEKGDWEGMFSAKYWMIDWQRSTFSKIYILFFELYLQ